MSHDLERERRAADELLAATKELEEAVLADGHEALTAATERRQRAYDQLRELVGERPPERLRGLLAEVARKDARLVSLMRKLQGDVRRQRQLIGVARDAARAVQPAEVKPRFIERRA